MRGLFAGLDVESALVEHVLMVAGWSSQSRKVAGKGALADAEGNASLRARVS